ncbi:MAG: hypothetical protein HY762_07570 [Planctomycetes bacterium]|nr:hypothetical protein [Planctomycetota bacterium]
MSVDKELDKLMAEMKVSLAGEKRKQAPNPNRILYIAIMMVVIMVLGFIFFSYYLDRMSAHMPPPQGAGNPAVANQPQPSGAESPATGQVDKPSEETTEYKSMSIRAPFRRGAKPVEPAKNLETEETPPAQEAPKGTGY